MKPTSFLSGTFILLTLSFTWYKIKPADDLLFTKGTIFEYDVRFKSNPDSAITEKRYFIIDSVYSKGNAVCAQMFVAAKRADGSFKTICILPATRINGTVKMDISYLLHIVNGDTAKHVTAEKDMIMGTYHDSMYAGMEYANQVRPYTKQEFSKEVGKGVYRTGTMNMSGGMTAPTYTSSGGSRLKDPVYIFGTREKRVSGQENITVPSGTYDSYMLKYNFSTEYEGDGYADEMAPVKYVTEWYKPGTGFIKREITDSVSVYMMMELRSISKLK